MLLRMGGNSDSLRSCSSIDFYIFIKCAIYKVWYHTHQKQFVLSFNSGNSSHKQFLSRTRIRRRQMLETETVAIAPPMKTHLFLSDHTE